MLVVALSSLNLMTWKTKASRKMDSIPRPELFDFHGVSMTHYFTDNWEDVQNLQARPDDILLVTYPKAGTTWVSNILDQLYFGLISPERQTSIPLYLRVPLLEIALPALQPEMDSFSRPELFDFHGVSITHYFTDNWENIQSFQAQPDDILIATYPKAVYVARNARDSMVSYFHYDRMNMIQPEPGDWSSYFHRFMEGKMVFGSWYDHVNGWWKKKQTYSKLHYMFYEDLIESRRKNELEALHRVHFDFMKKDDMVNHSAFSGMDFKVSSFIRKGKVGDWKNHFTVAQSEQFDEDYKEKMKDSTLQQKLKRDDGPVTRTIQQWSDQSDRLGSARLLQHDGVKPWVNGEVRAKLKARTDAYNSGDLEEYRKSRYALRRAISSAKRQYRDKVESHYKGSNTRSMWAGLKTLTDYKKKISSAEVMSASLPDELNTFYARFESTSPAVEVQKAQEDHCPPVISRADVCRTLKRINTRKAPGPDGIPGRALKVCADQLADVFADIFNMSLLQSVVPTCFKETIIVVPVPKKTKILSLNDYRPVALTSTIMKCFERLVKLFITSSIPDSLDPLQFAYRPNRSTEDAIALTLHTALSHLDQRDTYVRMLFIDYSSAFNTIRALQARHQAQRPRAQQRPV
ncbi:hypothetical protein L3Q82_003544 [Scortum barcoo]|uniref:Uncharacterized protein n=1 Tax=Scortum barcoo TaxID=214431 RepID=A0ACB8VMJ4_9TELE|nr:hypothetical protein L3Q82_003544 [Scortum barcoo]